MVANSWLVTIEEDPETKELIMPFPVDLLNQMGWVEGTKLFWLEQEDGKYIITDKKDESSKK